jgi:hypothetical protein
MATIPLPQRSEAPGSAPLSRIPVASDNRNIARLGAVASEAYMQPTLPKDMFRGDAIAGNAWGEALQNLGKNLSVLSMEASRIQNEKDIMEWDSRMNQAAADHRANLANNTDPRTWLPNWQKQFQGLQSALVSDKRLSPAARDQIQMRLSRFGAAEGINLQMSSVRENLRQVNLGYDTEEKRAMGEGRIDVARGFNKNALDKGFRSQADYEAKELEYNLAERSRKLENFAGTSAKDALIAADAVAQPGTLTEYGLTDMERFQWEQKYRGMAAARERQELDLIDDFFATGQYRSVEDLDASAENLRPATLAAVKEKVRKNMQVDPAFYQKRYAEVLNYNAATDESGLQKSELENSIRAEFPTSHAGTLIEQLNKRAAATEQGMSASDQVVANAAKAFTQDMEAGKYGVYKIPYDGKNIRWNEERKVWTREPFNWEDPLPQNEWPVIELDQETKFQLSDKDLREKLKGKTVEDLKAKQAAAERVAGKQSELLKKVETKELKSSPDVLEFYRRSTDGETLNEARSLLNPQAPVTGDLPDTSIGGGIDPSLFQSIYNQTR